MARVSAVDEFISEKLGDGSWTIDDRDTFYDMAQSGASSTTLYRYLADRGYTGKTYTVTHWRERNGGTGDLARRMNLWTRQARGVQPSDALNQLSFWLVDVLRKLYEALEDKEDIDNLSTKDLLFLISTYGGKAQTALSEGEKIKQTKDTTEIILGTIEEVRLAWRQTHEAENPELLGIIEPVLEQVRTKLDL